MIGYIFCHLLGLLHAAKFVGQCFVISTSIIERGIWIQLITFIFYFDLLIGREVAYCFFHYCFSDIAEGIGDIGSYFNFQVIYSFFNTLFCFTISHEEIKNNFPDYTLGKNGLKYVTMKR